MEPSPIIHIYTIYRNKSFAFACLRSFHVFIAESHTFFRNLDQSYFKIHAFSQFHGKSLFSVQFFHIWCDQLQNCDDFILLFCDIISVYAVAVSIYHQIFLIFPLFFQISRCVHYNNLPKTHWRSVNSRQKFCRKDILIDFL